MKICIATGTRAEYGLLKPLIEIIHEDKNLELQLLVTGTHLSPEFGLTYRQIESDGYRIDTKVEMLLSSDTAEGITKSIGLGLIGFADALKNLTPDLLIILGDRYEILSIAAAALIFKIPIAHLHGGELTEGAYDDSIRHAVTKLSHLHFTSTETYRNRVIQLGENPDRVHNVGAIGLDNISQLKKTSKAQIEEKLNIKFNKYNYLLAYHPETLCGQSVEDQFTIILDCIKNQQDSFFILTKSNADTDGRIINQMMEKFVVQYPDKAVLFASLGSDFLSIMSLCDAIIGNSSSGILEAPSLTATINIGDRQKGRIQAASVINSECSEEDLSKALETVKDPNFRTKIQPENSPYGHGNTAGKIIEIIKSTDIKKLSPKPFFDLI